MKLFKSLLTTLPSALLAGGCASGPKYSQYRPTLPPAPTGFGRVWFYRPSAMGAGVQPAVKLDDQVVGNAVPHGFFHVETLPGAFRHGRIHEEPHCRRPGRRVLPPAGPLRPSRWAGKTRRGQTRSGPGAAWGDIASILDRRRSRPPRGPKATL